MVNNMNKDRLQMYISVTCITIVICWLSLLSFWAIKLFGGNWFEIMVKNENFVKFCEYAENSWIEHFVNALTICLFNIFMYGAVSQRFYFKGKQLVVISIITISIWAMRFVPNVLNFHFWYAYLVIISYSFIIHKGKKRLLGILATFLDFAFSTISLLTRNVPLELAENFLIGNILFIDMYLMYFLYYLYSNLIRLKKEK